MNDGKSTTYQKAGVDPEKAASLLGNFSTYLKSRPRDPNLISGIGPFAACYSLKEKLRDIDDPVLVSCCDGVGTKLKLALEWGDITGLGQDLVGMNVNDLLCAGATPLLFLDYYACGKLDEEQLTTILHSIQRACEASHCSLAGGETAEMPGLYHADDFDLAGFSLGLADRKSLLGPQRVKAGDRILGLASSGFHSNGYSLVRKIIESEKLRGDDRPSFSDETWKTLLLKPTTLYVDCVMKHLSKVNALAHITGGGLYENLPRVLPENVSAEVGWKIPELFRWFQSKANIDDVQLLSTFNCGVGLIVIATPEKATELRTVWQSQSVPVLELGEVVERKAGTAQVVWQSVS